MIMITIIIIILIILIIEAAPLTSQHQSPA